MESEDKQFSNFAVIMIVEYAYNLVVFIMLVVWMITSFICWLIEDNIMVLIAGLIAFFILYMTSKALVYVKEPN